jgi:hypothetical protein
MKKTGISEGRLRDEEITETFNLLLEFFDINQVKFSVAISAMLKLITMMLKDGKATEKEVDQILKMLKKAWEHEE